jgi:SAM-dependent MidA family methyltransferase
LPFAGRGVLTVADFIDLALYDPAHGYYAVRPRRSGRTGDFLTSVDVGPLFGEMLAVQLIEMWRRIDDGNPLDLVEAGASDGRLARDILDWLAIAQPDLYSRVRVTLVERSAAARVEAAVTLRRHESRLAGISARLPSSIRGVIVANELLDAMPVHVLVKTAAGLREVYLDVRGDRPIEMEGPLSDPRLADGLDAAAMSNGARVERSLAIPGWLADVGARIERGFLLLVDYVRGRSTDTLLAYDGHAATPRWFERPGRRDITSHVDLEGVRGAAAIAGLVGCGCVDQTYFLTSLGILDRLSSGGDAESVARRLEAKTLILPGGLGSTMKVMAFAARVDGARLSGFERGRLT